MYPDNSDAREILGIDHLSVVLEDPSKPKTKRQPPSYSVPETEEQWRSVRVTCGLNTPQSILDKVFNLKTWDKNVELQPWQKTVIIAASIVDVSIGQVEEDDVAELSKIYSRPPGYETRRKDRAAILNLINLFDRLYAGLEHRAFELLVIWNTPLSTLRLWTSRKYEELYDQSHHITLEPREEIQAAIPLYMPFLVHVLRPQYTLKEIDKALNTATLTQSDFEAFQRTINIQKAEPCLLHTLGNVRTPYYKLTTTTSPLATSFQAHGSHAEIESTKAIDRKSFGPDVFNKSVYGYTTFSISQGTQEKASQAALERSICNRIDRDDTHLVQYEWSDRLHTSVVDQIVDELARAGLVFEKYQFSQNAYVKHRGQLKVNSLSMQIIIPTQSPTQDPFFVSLKSSEQSEQEFNDRINWRSDRGLLLKRGTVLSTATSIFLISIVIPMEQS